MPFFSICLPVYNGSPFVRKAIGSVLEQSFQDLELVIYDNGSTDDTARIVRQYDDERIRVVREKNRVSRAIAAWHRVMCLGRGDYVLMLGHDDWFKPDFLEVAHRYIEKHDLDVFSGWMDCYDAEYRFKEVVTSASFIQSIPNAHQVGDICLFDGQGYIEGFMADFENGFSKMHLSTTWMKRSLYEKVGGFNTQLQYCAESELYLKLAHAGARFGFYWGRALVNYIGEGENRRAFFMPVDRRYQDFYGIPKIMIDSGMVGMGDYTRMVHSVNRRAAVQGFGYSISETVKNIRRFTPKNTQAWLVLCVLGALWSRGRQACDAGLRRLLKYASA